MKKCSNCKKEQPLENYQWFDKKKGRRSSRCKTCIREYYLQNNGKGRVRNKPYNGDNYRYDYFHSTKDGLQHVYILPEENYAGTTGNPIARERKHRYDGKNTKGFRVLLSCTKRDEALELEGLLHDLGYKGRHINNTYK